MNIKNKMDSRNAFLGVVFLKENQISLAFLNKSSPF
jgi:hypothetical protein